MPVLLRHCEGAKADAAIQQLHTERSEQTLDRCRSHPTHLDCRAIARNDQHPSLRGGASRRGNPEAKH